MEIRAEHIASLAYTLPSVSVAVHLAADAVYPHQGFRLYEQDNLDFLCQDRAVFSLG